MMTMTIPTLTLFVKGFKKQFSKLVKALVPQAFEVCRYSPAREISVPSVGTVRLSDVFHEAAEGGAQEFSSASSLRIWLSRVNLRRCSL